MAIFYVYVRAPLNRIHLCGSRIGAIEFNLVASAIGILNYPRSFS